MCSDVAHFPRPVREIPPHPIPQSCTNLAWILSLALSWNSAAGSMSSVGVSPFIMNRSRMGGCPAGWGLWLLSFCLSRTLGVRRQQVLHSFLAVTVMASSSCSPTSPRIPPVTVPIRLCHKHLDFPPWPFAPS